MSREPAKSFEDLIVWQKAHQWVLSVYKQSKIFPQEKKYGLTSQLRRSAISVPENIAEGFKKMGKGGVKLESIGFRGKKFSKIPLTPFKKGGSVAPPSTKGAGGDLFTPSTNGDGYTYTKVS